MGTFEKVIAILDASVGGPNAPVGVHGPFWRGVDRDQFVGLRVLGLPLLVVGDGSASNLVRALKGEPPFAAESGDSDSNFRRMPAGRDPVAPDDIAYIEAWIDGGCPRALKNEKLQVWRPRKSHYATLTELVSSKTHDIDWLRDALQTAVQLEFSTLPPYLTAEWTVKSRQDPSAESVRTIRNEEMLHFGLACNMLTAIGGTPLIADADVVPKYPGPLPWNIRPGLVVALRKLDKAQAKVFMEIESPQNPVLSTDASAKFTTIGEFYEAVLSAFKRIRPTLSPDRQLEGPFSLGKLETLCDVEKAIKLINLQGEGSNASPEEAPGDLAHYYRFGEIYNGHRFVKDAKGHWDYTGDIMPSPDVHDMADVPTGGYQRSDVPDDAVWELVTRFDHIYSDMLRTLQTAWTNGNSGDLGRSVGQMIQLGNLGRELVTKPKPNASGNYGPSFRYVS